jgi:CRISPR/Cas system CSM-associated protein Csm3 (group 7 of RAMP superfamily)
MTDHLVYVRARITGTLECESALHVGDGRLVPFSERGGRARGNEGPYNTVCIDANGSCYIPASTLRGFLRAPAGDPVLAARDRALATRLFGPEDASKCGKVRVYDAHRVEGIGGTEVTRPYWHVTRGTSVRHGIAIDAITGVAECHKLFRHEMVPAGTRFRLSIEADRLSHGDLQSLLRLLYRWDGSEASAIGKGKGKGQGRLTWDLEQVLVLTEDKLRAWLRSDAPLDDRFFDLIEGPRRPARPEAGLVFRICPTAPLLPNEVGFVHDGKHTDDHPPQLDFSALPDGRPCIPAASLRGMVRARARRIVATLAHTDGLDAKQSGEVADGLLDTLFGKVDRRGKLWFSDAEALAPGSPHPQFFNAIDRFTGGVTEAKLYNVKAVVCDELRLTVTLDPQIRFDASEGEWWKGLLLLVLRDAMEGDLAIGWGKARGYGAFHLKITTESGAELDTWPACLQELRRRGDSDDWVPALRKLVAGKVAECIERPSRPLAEVQP